VTRAHQATTFLRRYELRALVGGGDAAVVYQAEDILNKRAVTVTMQDPTQAANLAAAARIRREAEVLSALRHPAVARVYEYGEAPLGDGTTIAYAVTEPSNGDPLAHRVSQAPLAWAEAVEVANVVAEVLAIAHHHGVVHGNLTAAHVLLGSDGPKVVGFGTGGGSATASDDVYALGVLLHQMATGRAPHEPRRTGSTGPGASTAPGGPTATGSTATGSTTAGSTAGGGIGAGDGPDRAAAGLPVAGAAPSPDPAAEPELPHAVLAIVRRCMRRKATERPRAAQIVLDLRALVMPIAVPMNLQTVPGFLQDELPAIEDRGTVTDRAEVAAQARAALARAAMDRSPRGRTPTPRGTAAERRTATPTTRGTSAPTEHRSATPTERPTSAPAERRTAGPTERRTATPTERRNATPAERRGAAPTDRRAATQAGGAAGDPAASTSRDWRDGAGGSTQADAVGSRVRGTASPLPDGKGGRHRRRRRSHGPYKNLPTLA
jgi:serine/threonine protein kinase